MKPFRFGDFKLLNLKAPDWKKVRVLGILLLAGILLLSLRLPGGGRGPSHLPAAASPATAPPHKATQPQAAVPADPVAAQEAAMDRSLARILSRVAGAGTVHVAVSLAGGEARRFAQDSTTSRTTTTERGGSGGGATNRDTTQTSVQDQIVLARDGTAGGQAPVTAQILQPEVRGVLVVATGATSATVRAEISQAAAAAAGIPLYRVVVLPGREGS